MSYGICCVKNCLNTSAMGLLHTFPNPFSETERFEKWIKNIGGGVATLDKKFVANNRRVCSKHFEAKYFFGLKVMKSAVPTLHLPDMIKDEPAVSIKQEPIGIMDDASSCEADPLSLITYPPAKPSGTAKAVPQKCMTRENITNENVPIKAVTLPVTNIKPSVRLYGTAKAVPQKCMTREDITNSNVPIKAVTLPVTNIKPAVRLYGTAKAVPEKCMTRENITNSNVPIKAVTLPVTNIKPSVRLYGTANNAVPQKCMTQENITNLNVPIKAVTLPVTNTMPAVGLYGTAKALPEKCMTRENITNENVPIKAVTLPVTNIKPSVRLYGTVKAVPQKCMKKENISNSNVPVPIKAVTLPVTNTMPSVGLYVTIRAEEPMIQDITTSNIRSAGVPSSSNIATMPVTGKKDPTIQELKTTIKHLKRSVSRKEAAKKLLREKLSCSRKTAKVKIMAQITKNMTRAAKTFILMQMRQTTEKCKGRRFTAKEKILALSLSGLNQKAYKSLCEICVLPKRRTLFNFLQKVPLKPGINECLFTDLTKRVAKMSQQHKYCSLSFDLMPLTTNLCYDETNDEIIGFTNDGVNKTTEFCNQALVFMVRGIIKKYKQPISYIFCNNIKSCELAEQIRIVISKLQETGLKVIATTCNQSATNESAVKILLNSTKEENYVNGIEWQGGYFEVCNNKIIPIYDPASLLKGLRNHLINKNLQYIDKGRILTAKWRHIMDLYELAPGYNGVSLLPKLTANHVIPNLIPKTRFKYCAEVFSRSVGVALGHFASTGIVPEESTHTADLLMLFDNLFDSVNGNTHRVEDGKIFKTVVTPTSPHHRLWQDSLPIINSMKFIDDYGISETSPSITGWVDTIKAFQTILKSLHELGQKSIFLTNFNQNAIEDFFACIKSHACSGVPLASTFQSAYKTLVVNNLSGNPVKGNNDQNEISYLMTSMEHYFKDECKKSNNETAQINYIVEHLSIVPIDVNLLISSDSSVEIDRAATIAYCSGSILVKCRQIYKQCEACKSNLETLEEDYHRCIKTTEYENKKWLCYPTQDAFNFFAQTENITQIILNKYSNLNDIVQYIKSIYYLHIDMSFLTCIFHKLSITKFLLDNSANIHVTTWCKNINKILIGKKNHIDGDNDMQMSAYHYWQNNKTKKISNRIPRGTGRRVRKSQNLQNL